VLKRVVGSSVIEIVTQTGDDQRQCLNVRQICSHLTRLTTTITTTTATHDTLAK